MCLMRHTFFQPACRYDYIDKPIGRARARGAPAQRALHGTQKARSGIHARQPGDSQRAPSETPGVGMD